LGRRACKENRRTAVIVKIIFLCGSLEPGRDGVGDYTRKLAAEVIRQGHESFAVALNDHHLTVVFDGVQHENEGCVPVLRLPASDKEKVHFTVAKDRISKFNPDVISLQFVPYSFQQKGLPFTLYLNLISLGRYPWHIMFHELWLDSPKGIKQQITAVAQRFIIGKLVAKLKPTTIDVSISFNQERLRKIRIKSEILHLFGNISKSDTPTLSVRLNDVPQNSFKILYFGAAPKGKYLELVVDELANFCKITSKVCIMIVGGNSDQKNVFINNLSSKLSDYNATIIDFGFLASSEVSELLDICSIGIVRSEPKLLGKSGSALAMLEHGCRIWLPKWNTKEPLNFHFRNDLIFSNLIEAKKYSDRPPFTSLLTEVAKQFITQIKI